MNTAEEIKKQMQAQFEMVKRHTGTCHWAKEMKKGLKRKRKE